MAWNLIKTVRSIYDDLHSVISGSALKVDIQDTTIVAEFTPGSTVNVDAYTPTGTFQPATSANQTALYAYFFDSEGNPLAIPSEPNTETHTFHNAAQATTDGTDLECDGQYKKLRVEMIRANCTTCQIDFLQSVNGTDFFPLLGMNVAATTGAISMAINTTATASSLWEFDIAGAKYIRMDLSTLTGVGATVTVKGVAVA